MNWNELPWQEAEVLLNEAKGQPKMRAMLRTEGNYIQCDCQPVYEHPNGRGLRTYNTGHEFEGLEVHCQGNIGESTTYAWKIQYRAYAVELDDAERMVKALRKFDRAMRRMADQEGEAKTFGQFVNRAMRAMKIETGITGNYQRWTAGEFVDMVDGMIYRALKKE